MVEQLDQAGIRFVHFSYENELLSRVCRKCSLISTVIQYFGRVYPISLNEQNSTCELKLHL